ncbi:MAG: HAD family hydrolase [Treponema sp.]|jgi:putative hydrolase of the HAD superfamily|nr:HAD family hydrolase [Treponema sp.]
MKKDISAVAFDLDGTLYPNYRFYLRLVPFILREQRLLRALGKARNILRRTVGEGEGENVPLKDRFYHLQSRVMADILKDDPERIKNRTETLIYRGWEPIFTRIKLFPHVRETLGALREGGLKLGLLSDFPPEFKLENLKLGGFWDAVICSETTGRLKPDPVPFLELARRLGSPPGEILYVGNSVSYDIIGAKSLGMKAALVAPRLALTRRWKVKRSSAGADFVFHDYRQLRNYVLG